MDVKLYMYYMIYTHNEPLTEISNIGSVGVYVWINQSTSNSVVD